MERTLVLLKPDCVERRLMGRVIIRFEEKGLNIIAMKMLRVTPALAKQHYAEHVAKPFYPGLEKFITASPILAMVVEGLEVIRVVREMLVALVLGLRGHRSSSSLGRCRPERWSRWRRPSAPAPTTSMPWIS